MNQEELKPCPVCGEPPYSENVGEKHFIKTPTPNDIRYWCRIHRDAIYSRQSWNDAYCWKEIDRLKAELADYGKRAIENDAVMRKRCYEAEAALQAKDAEIAELKAKNERLETQLACAADFANTWARESGVMECDNPYFGLYLRDLISRLWDKLSSRYIAELGRSEKLVQALDKIAFGSLEKNFHELTTNKPDREIALEALEVYRKTEEAGK